MLSESSFLYIFLERIVSQLREKVEASPYAGRSKKTEERKACSNTECMFIRLYLNLATLWNRYNFLPWVYEVMLKHTKRNLDSIAKFLT